MRTIEIRSGVATIAFVGAFLASLVFYGPGRNLAMLVLSSGLLLFALSLVGPARLAHLTGLHTRPVVVALVAIAILVFNYHLSYSKETSFPGLWVLAAVPLSFLFCGAVEDNGRRWIVNSFVGIATLLASVALYRLLAYGERAHQPLIDPNNFATLLYLAWIPLAHASIFRGDSRTPNRFGRLILAFVLVAGIFATQSRTAAAIVVMSLVAWLAVSILRRSGFRWLCLHSAAALLAYVVVVVASPGGDVTSRIESVGLGLSVRLDLIDAALRVYADRPLLGVGLLCFGLMYGAHRPLSEQETTGLFVHNDYVQFLAEGGALLLALPVALALFAAYGCVRGVMDQSRGVALERMGFTLAIGAACAHALVNFVFFSLPLAIVIGSLAALVVRESPSANDVREVRTAGWSFAAALAVGWLWLAYLVVDTFTAGVLQGQKSVPFTRNLRESPQGQLEYARLAQQLNDDRAVPFLAEALLLTTIGDREPSKAVSERALRQYRRAISIDPWNPLAYVGLAHLAKRDASELRLGADETPERLSLTALGLDPIFVPAIDSLLEIYNTRGRIGDGYRVLKEVVFPWLELLKRRDPEATERYVVEMNRLATLAGDTEFVNQINAKKARLSGIVAAEHRDWLGFGT